MSCKTEGTHALPPPTAYKHRLDLGELRRKLKAYKHLSATDTVAILFNVKNCLVILETDGEALSLLVGLPKYSPGTHWSY